MTKTAVAHLLLLTLGAAAQDVDPFVLLSRSAESLLKGDPQRSPAPLKAKVAMDASGLRQAVRGMVGAEPMDSIFFPAFNAILASFKLSSVSEWNDYAKAEAGLEEWIALLKLQVRDEREIAELALRLGERHVNRWLAEKPVEAAKVMDRMGEEFAGAAGSVSREQWYFYQIEFEWQLRNRSLARDKELQIRMDKYLSNAKIPLRDRTSMCATLAEEFYAAGEPDSAAKYLSEFAKAHPEALKSIKFRHAFFFVQLCGLGNRTSAEALLQELELTGTRVSDAARNDPAFTMWDAYYSRLPLTDDELRRSAWMEMAARRKQKIKHDTN